MASQKYWHLFAVLLAVGLSACTSTASGPPACAVQNAGGPPSAFRPVAGFPAAVNAILERFMTDAETETGRKIAVFDGDGTVVGQVPHYLADECLYQYAAAHPAYKAALIAEMTPLSNVSVPYVEDRVHFFAGLPLQELRALGESCFHRWYPTKIFAPMRALIARLKERGFEIWIVSASPEVMYQGFLAHEFGIPLTRVIGAKSVVRGGLMTDEIVRPVPQDEGKLAAIETIVQDRPLLVAGNSRGDKEMIEYSRGLHMMVNPDEFVAPDQEESVADYAKRHGWLVVRIRDVAEPGFPALSAGTYHVPPNKSNPGP